MTDPLALAPVPPIDGSTDPTFLNPNLPTSSSPTSTDGNTSKPRLNPNSDHYPQIQNLDPSMLMAADVSAPPAPSNPCCADVKRKYEKVKASLMKACSVLERNQNTIKEEQLKTKLEKEAKKKEIVIRKTLENDIHELKAQIASLSQETKNLLEADKSGDELERVKQILEEERKKTHSEKKNAANAWNLLQIEKGKVEEERGLVQIERSRANELSASVEKVKREFGELSDQLAKRVEEEKQKANREKRRADAEKAKLEEQKKYAERETTRAVEEKSRADSLLKKLEEEREKTKDLLKKLEEERKRNKDFKAKLANAEREKTRAVEEESRADNLLKKLEEEREKTKDLLKKLEEERKRNKDFNAKLANGSSQKQKGGVSVKKEDLNVKLLKEKLKLRKAQLKHVKKILKLEKSKNNIIKQEFGLLKQDFIQISSRFKVLDSHLNIGGTSDLAKVILELSKPAAPLSVTTDRHVFLRQGGAHYMSRQSQSRPVSGTSSESLLPNQQNFALSSDKKLLMGPQDRERDASVSSAPLFQNQKNTEACTKSSLEILNISRKRKKKESSDPMKKVKIQNVNNHLNSEVVEFEKVVREGGVLKLLEFENEDLEKRFRSAMEGFLSPNLPQITPRKIAKVSYKGDIDNLEGKDKDEHLIPQFDLKSRLNLMETMRADGERHERSRCLNGNGKILKGSNKKHSHYFLIVFSNLSENTKARIGRIWKEITAEEPGVSKMIDLSARVLQLASKAEFILEDKIYVICSLLASEICRVLLSHPIGVSNFSVDKHISSIAEETCSVLSEEMLRFFIKNNLLENIISLLEDFLLFKQVLVYTNDDLCSTISTKNQFISSCIMFALICAKTNQLDLIRGTAYKILLKGKSGISHALISIHIFASICGERLFRDNEEKLLQNALCWVVYCVEKGGTHDLGFAPCQHCPFKMEAAGAEGFVDLLLDELEACSLLKNQEPHFVCGEHCSTSMAERNNLCYFTEIVSLLELVGSYMAWECSYKKVVCRLWKILESCGHEELTASILVLIGHLSRSVLDEDNYNQIQVSELRDKLSNFIQTKDKSGLALQFACISALLNLIPLNVKQILMEDGDLSSDKGQFCREICQIKNWFSGLSKKQKGAFQSLFMGC